MPDSSCGGATCGEARAAGASCRGSSPCTLSWWKLSAVACDSEPKSIDGSDVPSAVPAPSSA
eukprot:scaffold18116_cov123-Isochrysis_galbana.AAC.6